MRPAVKLTAECIMDLQLTRIAFVKTEAEKAVIVIIFKKLLADI